MKHKFENIIVNSMIGFLMLSLLLVGVRLLAKEILVDRLGMENRLLQGRQDSKVWLTTRLALISSRQLVSSQS